jgi:TPR repeat protein
VTTPIVAHDNPAPRKVRDDQLDAAEAALRRGDATTAADILKPWAAAGVPRAQAMLGRAKEGRGAQQQSDFEAYVWYSMAARGGEPGAQALRDKVAVKLQPAEIRQAEQVIERWKPQAEPTASLSR